MAAGGSSAGKTNNWMAAPAVTLTGVVVTEVNPVLVAWIV
jgi:hypothetical protein